MAKFGHSADIVAAYSELCSGPHATIFLLQSQILSLQQATDIKDEICLKRKCHLERFFREFCTHPFADLRLGSEKFKKEGNFLNKFGAKVELWGFHAFKWSLYGAMCEMRSKRCFVGAESGPTKSQKDVAAFLKINERSLADILECLTKGE